MPSELVERIIEAGGRTLRIPAATYRVQFNRAFAFAQAQARAGYLHALGVSALYASPFLKARPESTHGYDVTDHNALNPAIGSDDDLGQLVAALHREGMGQVLDVVPNHMGIGPANPWWMDVLENGQAARHAEAFDIDWRPLNTSATGKVLLPILGDHYGTVLENGELTLEFRDGAFFIHYYDDVLPVDPRTDAEILRLGLEGLIARLGPDDPAVQELQSIITAASNLPARDELEPERMAERAREKEIVKRRLASLWNWSADVRAYIGEALAVYNGEPGSPRSFDRLDALLDQQAYRLSYWRVAGEEINYRRFFEINDLAAIRVERPAVFAESHRLILSLLARGALTGLRIDHIDGLWDPGAYTVRLQAAYLAARFGDLPLPQPLPEAAGGDDLPPGPLPNGRGNGRDEISASPEDDQASTASPSLELPLPFREGGRGVRSAEALEVAIAARLRTMLDEHPESDAPRPLWVVVEKILATGERLPDEWAVYGTTGYDFVNAVGGLFVDQGSRRAFDDIYTRFTGVRDSFRDIAYDCKQLIMDTTMASELNVLGHQLSRLAQRNRRTRDFTLNSLTDALREVTACFPVYRTYISETTEQVNPRDRAHIETAVARARRRNLALPSPVFDFVRDTMLLEPLEGDTEEDRAVRRDFVMKFQQYTGPVTAKGVEDTAFYRYNRLVSLNEVGGEPEQFGTSVAAFHRQNGGRQRRWPAAMIATATHDTKRGEDTRVRISVLSELPREWRAALTRWSRSNRRHKATVDGALAPDRNDEYLLYQTLLGAWPLEPNPLTPSMSAGPPAIPSAGIKGTPPASDDVRGLGEPIPASGRGWGGIVPHDFVERVQAYMLKAVKEAKVNTSWINPNAPYDEAVQAFVAAILGGGPDDPFLRDFLPLQRRIARTGMVNSLAQVVLKIASPGVPDVYQGTEFWDLSLVDPDNRRPVDYDARETALRAMAAISEDGRAAAARELLAAWPDGRVKLYVLQRALTLRRAQQDLFIDGAYLPLDADGPQREHVCAFARSLGDRAVIAVAPRLVARLAREPDGLPLREPVWRNTVIRLPAALSATAYRDRFTGAILRPEPHEDGSTLPLAAIFTDLPVALLEDAPEGKAASEHGPGADANHD